MTSPTAVPVLPDVPTGRARWWTAGTTVAVAALLCLGAYAGIGVMMVAALVTALVFAAGWPALLALPSPRGTTVVLVLGGALSVLAVGLDRDEPLLQWLALALAGSVVAEITHQLARRDGRPRLVESTSGALTGVTVLASMSAVTALPRTSTGAAGVVLVVAPVTVALVVQLVALPVRLTALAGVVAAALVGGALGGLLAGPGAAGSGPVVLAAVVSGVLGSVVALTLHRLLVLLPAAGWAPGLLALAVGPLASSGMVGYVVLRLVVG